MSDPRDVKKSDSSTVVLTEQEQRWADRFEKAGVEVIHSAGCPSNPNVWEHPRSDHDDD